MAGAIRFVAPAGFPLGSPRVARVQAAHSEGGTLAITGTGARRPGRRDPGRDDLVTEDLRDGYVIAEPCVDVMDQACVAVCPVD